MLNELNLSDWTDICVPYPSLFLLSSTSNVSTRAANSSQPVATLHQAEASSASSLFSSTNMLSAVNQSPAAVAAASDSTLQSSAANIDAGSLPADIIPSTTPENEGVPDKKINVSLSHAHWFEEICKPQSLKKKLTVMTRTLTRDLMLLKCTVEDAKHGSGKKC